MRPLTKKEKDLLRFAASGTMGTIRTTSGDAQNTAWKLSQRKLMTRNRPVGPFAGNDTWSLTDEGWAEGKKLLQVKKESVSLSQPQLRSLIEAEVDKMRLPRGPNSRDDADDRRLEHDDESGDLTEVTGFEDRTDFETLDVHGELVAAGEYLEMALDRLENALKADRWQGGTLDRIYRGGLERIANRLHDEEYVAILKSAK